jgi:CBS domain-containing protein
MMPHAMVLKTKDTLARAATLMSREGFHHLLVVDDAGTLCGVVSTFDVTRWVARLTA